MIIDEYICNSCTYDELVNVRNFVFEQSLNLGADNQVAQNISLAVDEAVTNLIEHGFKTENKYFNIKIFTSNEFIVTEIMDNGITFDPIEIQKPNMNQYFKEFKRGGLGIHIIRSLMDSIEYIPSNKNQKFNLLRLKKSINVI